jgi:putative permease
MFRVVKSWWNRYFYDEEALILFAIMAAVLVLVLYLGNSLGPVFISVILAFLMQGLVSKLVKYNVPHLLAVSLVFTVFVGVLFVSIFLLLPLAWHQLFNLLGEFPRMLAQGQKLLAGLPEQYPEIITNEQIQVWIKTAGSEIGKIGQWLVSYSLSNITNLFAVIIYLILVPLLVFFFLKDKEVISQWVLSILPNDRKLMTTIWFEMDEQIENYVRGKVIEIVVVGAASYVTFSFMGLNYAELLAIFVGLSVIVPYIGAAVVTIPVALVSSFQWGWTSEFFYLMAAYGVIQALDGNVLVPFLFSEVVNLHPVAIIVAVLFFGGLWGLWGVFLAIPLATLIKALLSAWPRHDTKQSSV